MKKVLFALVLIMAVMVVNAQVTTTTTQEKSTVTAVKVADLQKAITDNVAKDYPGYTIMDATSVNTNDVLTYNVVIGKDAAIQTLVYDKDGKFLKLLPVAPKVE
jgi:hypothetical protein